MKEDLALAHGLAARRLPFANLLAGWRPAAIAVGLVLIVLLPFVAKNFFIFQLTLALIYAIAILGLNLLTGFNGQFSLGHSAFYAIGAYTAAILMDQADMPYYWTLPAAGLAIIAIRENPIAASAMGVNVSLYKSLTFGVSALYTGIAGALGAIAVQFVAPDSFTFFLSIALFVGLIVGGVGSIPGTLVGGLFVLFVPNIAEQVSKGLAGAVYGVILILVIYVMPSGAAGLARLLAGQFARLRK